MTDDLSELVLLARNRDADAFGALVTRFSAAVRSICMMRAADPAQADDIAQQVFLTAWKKLPELNPDVPFWPWLETITRNHLLNEWRRVQRERGLKQRYTVAWLAQSEGEDAQSQDPEILAAQVETLRLCIRALPENLQKMVKMRYDDNYTSDRIATLMGRSADAVRQTFVRLREKLRDCIERKLIEQA